MKDLGEKLEVCRQPWFAAGLFLTKDKDERSNSKLEKILTDCNFQLINLLFNQFIAQYLYSKTLKSYFKFL